MPFLKITLNSNNRIMVIKKNQIFFLLLLEI